ncbi:hypothetical protein Daura_24050 [Dactylosporangium aurantiacum]|uniref:Uncharacterized protein n=1 Tax=Dactylosporangium aurantiacum TaxID=35754 RepID=A0A9Q9IT69_9ACTN|nr:hypothetical protein [Dactylosporangium aurantiacum]MDG6103835.1 hypothetical protein [Dactylosporangium aurantiacum]UWZ58965.1 hypothetical protein Daura_24050 [Dactylosporangium aurantiacum]
MEPWIIAVVAGAVLLPIGILVAVSRATFRAVAPAGASGGFGLLPGRAMRDGLAAGWEQERALMTAVLRDDLRSVRAGAASHPEAAAHLQAAERAVDLFAANEDWADNMRAATAAMGRANRAVAGTDRPPCLFNPAHGPSAAEVEWAPRSGAARRRVPVCAEDAARLCAGTPPQARTVQTDEGVVPYYAAHGRYVDWLLGWYDGFDPYLTARLLAGTAIGSHLPGRIRAIHGAGSDPLGEFGSIHDD